MNKYITVMFPYPSGAKLHVGHWYNYSIVDSYCKLQKYLGYEVFQPFGYDSFGLPTENYAKKIGKSCLEATEENIQSFEIEMKRMNTSFVTKLSTHTKEYQLRTQWLFNELLRTGLAYKAIRPQHYCESCETTLSNEQVIQGKCERCNSTVVMKELNQWFFKITNYKQRLINDLSLVDYPEASKKQQINWLNNLQDWCISRQRKWGCPIPIEGEEDTLDTFVDSSFYTIEYDKTRPVNLYVGGSEHTTKHLIYARFITKFLFDIGYINFNEPFLKVIHQGMILGTDGNKMSKSLGNVINPEQYEPQLLRMYLMFINHYFEGGKWQDAGYKGCERFRNKLFNWFNSAIDKEKCINTQQFKKTIIGYFESWKTNKIVSEWMIFYNTNKNRIPSKEDVKELQEFFDVCF